MRAAKGTKPSTFSALGSANFRIFWVCSGIYFMGKWIAFFAQGYLVVLLAIGDGGGHLVPLYTGFFGLAQAIPGLTAGLVGGVVADRFDRRRVIVTTQTCIGMLNGVLAWLTLGDRITIVGLLVIVALLSTTQALDGASRFSWLPSLVPRRSLVSAVGLHTAGNNSAQLLGPALGGLLYLPLGISGLLLVIATCHLAVAGGQLFIRSTETADRSIETAPPHRRVGSLRSLAAGLRYIVRDSVTLWLFVVCAASQFLVRPYVLLLPSFAEQVLHTGAVQLSWLMTASGAGALLGSLVVASLDAMRRRGRFLIIAAIVIGFTVILLAAQRTLAGAVVVVAILGLTTILFQGTANAMLQLRTPDHLRGRVIGVFLTFPQGIMPLGVSALGFIGAATGLVAAMALGGALFGLFALGGRAFAKNLWRLQDADLATGEKDVHR